MGKETDILEAMLDYVRQLKRHAEGRRALHIKMSTLERHMQEPYYRREVASALRPLVTNKGAKLFALPNADLVVTTSHASLDDIAPTINDIRKKLRDSSVLSSLDPMVGVSDRFIEWFDLESDYADFATYAEQLAEQVVRPAKKPSQAPGHGASKEPDQQATVKKSDPAEAPVEDEHRQLDAFVLAGAMRKIPWTDVSDTLAVRPVFAIVGSSKPVPALMHKYVDFCRLLEKLTNVTVEHYDRWLEGYLSETVAIKLLESQPDLGNEASIATSIRLTCSSVLSGEFQRFDDTLPASAKTAIAIEFSLIDILAHPRAYEKAFSRVKQQGYKVSLADVEPESLVWLNHEKLHATFIKLHKPADMDVDWVPASMRNEIAAAITEIGKARVILDGCSSEHDIQLGQQLGITLFQGAYFD